MRFLANILAKAGLIVDGAVTFNNVPNATVDTDRFLVVDSGVVKYRTGAQLMSDVLSQFQTDYDQSIVGTKNGSNKVFNVTSDFVPGTTRVFVNGLRYTPGAIYDYLETANNQITFTNAPDAGDIIIVEYIKS